MSPCTILLLYYRESILTKLEHFDVTKQLPEDAMHVLLEGIVPLHIGLFLNKVTSLKLMNLDALNGAVQSFPYQYFEISSKPSTIPKSAVLDQNLTGKQSGNLLCELIFLL